MVRGRLNIGRIAGFLLLGSAAANLSCAVALVNDTADLGGTTPGSRGNLTMQFVNNTPFRAIFTFGTYDAQNTLAPNFNQFTADADPTKRLEGNTTSQVFTFTVGRTASVGGQRLIQLIKDQKLTANADALVPGITFSSSPLDSPDAAQPTAGRAEPNEALLGIDYQPESRIVYTFSVDASQPSGIRVDRTVILP